MKHLTSRLLSVAVALSATLAGCGGEAARRDAQYATFRASMHEQRAAAYQAYAEQLRALVTVQQAMLSQSLARPQAAPPPPPAPQPHAAPASAPSPLPLLDPAGGWVPGSSYGPVGDIVARVEGYLGRPLSGPERTALGQILRRPRAMDTTDPWPVLY